MKSGYKITVEEWSSGGRWGFEIRLQEYRQGKPYGGAVAQSFQSRRYAGWQWNTRRIPQEVFRLLKACL